MSTNWRLAGGSAQSRAAAGSSDTTRMRFLKRNLLRLAEIGVLVFGFSFSVALAGAITSVGIYGHETITAFSGFCLTVVVLLLFRRKTRQWKTESDAAAWMAHRSWRQLHPRKARYMRMLRRWLMWLPSGCAALTVFFLPVASQITFVGTHVVPHYRLSVPINWVVIRTNGDSPYAFVLALFSNQGASRFGLTPVWFDRSLLSGVTIGSTDPATPYTWSRPETELARGHTTHTARRQFAIGTAIVDCWEYRDTYDVPGSPPSSLRPRVLWEVLCSTRPNGHNFNLHASFTGREEDIPVFYRVLKRATPIN